MVPGCIWKLFRLIILAAVVVVLLALLLPRFIAQAGNTLFNNGNSNVPSLSGLAQFFPSGSEDKNNKLQVSLSGLSANTKYDVSLDPGQCGTSDYVDVGIITSDDSGNVNTTFNLSPLDTGKNWFVDIHNGTGVSDSTLDCEPLNMNSSSVAIEATNTTLQLSPVASQLDSTQVTPGTTNTPTGFPNTGVAPGSNNSYDNTVYPRKF